MRAFAYKPGYLPGGNDVCTAPMTLAQGMHAAIESPGSIGITWSGEKNPAESVKIYVKNAMCSAEATPADGWHTLLLLPEAEFQYSCGYLYSGNDLLTGSMTLEEAMEAARTEESIGFTWNGDRDAKEKLKIWVKDVNCSKQVVPCDGWHTMLKSQTLDTEGQEIVMSPPAPLPKQEEVSSELGMWPADVIAGLARAGVNNIGFREDPLPVVLEALGDERFVDAEFPPLPVSLGQGTSMSAIAGKSGRSLPEMQWMTASDLFKNARTPRSMHGTKPASVKFVSCVDFTLQVYWVSYGGQANEFTTIDAHGTTTVTTSATHVWRFCNIDSGEEVLTYTCSEDPEQSVDVGAEAQIAAKFRQYDTNGDGSIDAAEMKRVLSGLGMTQDEVAALFSEADMDGDGRLSTDEFAKWLFSEEKPDLSTREPHVFQDGTCNACDVVQGGIGDCWLMQSIASAANRFPETVVECVNPKQASKQGVYSIKFWSPRYKYFFYILVDDYFPTSNGKLSHFAQFNSSGDGLWVMLYEKAFAKLQGSFAKLDCSGAADSPSTALCRMLGGEPGCRWWKPEENASLTSSESLWHEMVERRAAGRCSTLSSAKGPNTTEIVGQDGMVTFHGYTLMDLVEIQGFKLMKIRNVWGRQEWNGDWSDESPLWDEHPDIAQELGRHVKDDGIFFMSYPDFVTHFCMIWHN
eukprot:TRINITY_DN61841_c0_g1_i1.p1 TRINITY_DN61841_c0_g1~~TRINITY_DN61841_c0_g1_i1.p1  ORF type:complete len:690 (+),score=117.44 TRINITY_DN61841_c0_g1_i1:57-2126(+)